MTSLSRKFKAVTLAVICAAGMAACSKPPAEKALDPAAAAAAVTAVEQAEKAAPLPAIDPAVEPNDPALRGFFLSYSQVDTRKDLNYDLNLGAVDGKAVSTVTISVPKTIPDASPDDFASMQRRNKALLDFMSACLGSENTRTITQLSEGRIIVLTTPVQLQGGTVEITTVTPGRKGHTVDAVLACQDKGGDAAKTTAAVGKLKADALAWR